MNQRSSSTAATILISAALSLLACGKSSLAQSLDAPENRIISEYIGHYICAQGTTNLTIQFLRPERGSEAVAIFKFGPSPDNQSVPFGAFLLTGTADLSGGRLDLRPLSWLSQPHPRYLMVGLSGASSDGGKTFEGIVDGFRCSTFSIGRVLTSSVDALPTPAPTKRDRPRQQTALPFRGGDFPKKPPQETSQRKDGATEIPLQKLNGVFVIPVSINGALTMNFTIDSGAADVSIPADVFDVDAHWYSPRHRFPRAANLQAGRWLHRTVSNLPHTRPEDWRQRNQRRRGKRGRR